MFPNSYFQRVTVALHQNSRSFIYLFSKFQYRSRDNELSRSKLLKPAIRKRLSYKTYHRLLCKQARNSIISYCYTKLRVDPNSHRSPLELSYYDIFELRHFVISELQTSGAIC